MSSILFLHIISIGIWIGVVATEFVIEFSGMRNHEARVRASRMHYLTDIWIEVPAFLTALITGFLMLQPEHLSGAFLVKIIFGLLAVGFNAICVFAVFKRQKHAVHGDVKGMDSAEPFMKLGALMIPTFLIAMGLGLYFVFTY